jgi:hypothetical protein
MLLVAWFSIEVSLHPESVVCVSVFLSFPLFAGLSPLLGPCNLGL